MTKKKKQSVITKNLLAGIGILVPLGTTFGLVAALVSKVDNMIIGKRILADNIATITGGLPHMINPGTYAPVLYEFPGIGLVVLTGCLFVSGMLVRTWVGNKIFNLTNYLMNQVPIVGTAYSMIKKVVTQITAQSDNMPEKKAVWVEHLREDVYAPAFSLGKSTMFCSPKTGLPLTLVYFPSAPNPTSGWIILVPDSHVHDAKVSADVMMELILSCGISQTKVAGMDTAFKASITPTGEIITTDGVVMVTPDEDLHAVVHTCDIVADSTTSIQYSEDVGTFDNITPVDLSDASK